MEATDSSKNKEPGTITNIKRIITLKPGGLKRNLRKTEWAEELDTNEDCPMVENPAMIFPFELDNFQKQAISAIENGYNVFVAAHTSAGKTVVAEYAIAMSKRNSSRAIYTSPVKALSNQKYNDFKKTFEEVGLITGDVQINDTGECIIMTTEILRSMLYNSSDKIRNLEFVIFDEVHYINDPERGHVWEEVLILLPPSVQIVMLSATVPNVVEFADWVGRTQQRKVMVCTTLHRPVPLQHFLYLGGGGVKDRLFLLKNGDGPFVRDKYFELDALKKDQEEKQKSAKRRQINKLAEMEKKKRIEMAKQKGERANNIKCPNYSEMLPMYKANRDKAYWRECINFLQTKDWMPTVVFAFSRKICDNLADLLGNVDLTTKTEKMHITSFFKRQIDKLDEVDRNIPQIEKLGIYLTNGIGVHHSGILPILKEIVEVLFQQGRVKMLFATETFAMGVNMPARTVVFNSIKKFDGNNLRVLLPSEYIQMAGRAGRRGKDTAGNVIIITQREQLHKLEDLEGMMLGSPCHLQSQFKLTHRMILTAFASPGKITVQTIMERSYCENNSQQKHSQYRTDLEKLKQTLDEAEKTVKEELNEDEHRLMLDYFSKAFAYSKVHKKMRKALLEESKIRNHLESGRLLRISKGLNINRIGVLIDKKRGNNNNEYYVMITKTDQKDFKLLKPKFLDNINEDWKEKWYLMLSLTQQYATGIPIDMLENETTMIIVQVHDIVEIYKNKISLSSVQIPNILRDAEKATYISRVKYCEDTNYLVSQLTSSYNKTLNVVNEGNVLTKNAALSPELKNMVNLKEELDIAVACIASIDRKTFYEKFEIMFNWKQQELQLQQIRYNLSAESMTLYPDYVKKLALLREKQFISESDTVLLKGLMAARVSKYELIVSELLMENVLLELGPEEVAALLSVLVCQSKVGTIDLTNNENNDFLQPVPTVAEDKIAVKPDKEIQVSEIEDVHFTLPDSLNNAIKKVKDIIAEIHHLEQMYDIADIDGSEVHKLSFDLVPLIYSWAKQDPFKEMMKLAPDLQEGLVVRYIQQLLEALKEVETASKVMGDPSVPEKISQAGEKIKRGIVFAPSLYTTFD